MKKTALVVDDSSSFRSVVSMSLKQAGFEVVEAMDGLDGVVKIDAGDFGLVICDLNMPKMDGFAFTQHVRANPRHRFTPILMLTTETQEFKKAQGKAAGVTAWLSKPFQPSRLIMAVNAISSR
jgi:two-component system chemotaxis response regulator CheY